MIGSEMKEDGDIVFKNLINGLSIRAGGYFAIAGDHTAGYHSCHDMLGKGDILLSQGYSYEWNLNAIRQSHFSC